jgi:hemoglobin
LRSMERATICSPTMTHPESPARRAMLTEGIARRTGIDEAIIERLVREFYGRIQRDALLGPIFAERIADWEPHIRQICAFWASVALMTGQYHGRPMQLHMPLPVDAAHFDRWLDLFEATARGLCPPAAADHFIERAHRIADSLELGINATRGILPTGPGPSGRRAVSAQGAQIPIRTRGP